MNYLTYPLKVMGITQSYDGSYSHYKNSSGTPRDYPIDDAGSDGGRDWLYCPCDEMRIAAIRYVGDARYANQLWLQSTSKVVMPCGEDYVTIMVAHPEDEDLRRLRVGQYFKRGDEICKEGRTGNATGNHFHISVAKGLTTAYVKNLLGGWVIRFGAIKPEQAFYIDEKFTEIGSDKNLKFEKLPTEQTGFYKIGQKVKVKKNSLGYVSSNAINARTKFTSDRTWVISKVVEKAAHPYCVGLKVGDYVAWVDRINVIKE